MDFIEIIPDDWTSPTFSSSLNPSSLTALVNAYSSAASRSSFIVYSDKDVHASRHSRRFLDLFDFAGDSPAIGEFVKSFDALVEFIESTDINTRRFGTFHLTHLAAVAEEFGHDSDAYQGILLALKATLNNVSLISAS